MKDRKRIFYLIIIMAAVGLVSAGIAMALLYRTGFEGQRARLVETAESRARLIEAVARFDAVYSRDYLGGPATATISQVVDAHKNFEGFGETGEFTLARREGEEIVFLLSHRHHDDEATEQLNQEPHSHGTPDPVPFDSELAEPMRRALSGESGSLVGLDYRGETVLAAYEPVAVLDLGIVAKIDLAEVRAPFVRAAVAAAATGFFVLVIGTALFFRISDPIMRRLKVYSEELEGLVSARTRDLAEANETLQADNIERKRAETALKIERDYLEKLHNSLGEAVFTVKMPERTIEYANLAVKTIFGYEPEECVGEKTDRFYPEGGAAEFGSKMREAVGRGDELLRTEQILKRKNGELFPAGITTTFLREDGELVKVISIVRDITKRKRAEEALELLGAITTNMAEGAYLVRTNDVTIVYTNPEFEKIFGYDPGEMLGKHASIVNAPTDKSPEETAIEISSKIRERGVWSGEVLNKKKDGTPFWCYASISTFDHHEYGEVWIAVHTDITERKRAEDALKESEQRYRLLVDNIDLGISLIDKDYKIIMTNRHQARMFKKPDSSLIGTHCFKGYMNRTEVCANCPGTIAMETKKPAELDEDGVLEDGSKISVHIKAFPLINSEGNVTGFIEVVEDITGRRRMEAEILKSQKLESLGVLAGGIAHDFNNLLTGITGNLSLVKHYTDPKNKSYKRLVELEKATIHAKELTQQLLTFSRGGAPVTETVYIGELIKESATFSLRGSGIRCDLSIPDDLWCVEADTGQLTQVINNLVINASQAMPEGGVIAVTAENITRTAEVRSPLKEGRYVLVSIKDQGTGISGEHLKKIFDPYFTTKQKGSGLGLSSVYSIIKKHEGHIDVESKLGEGTTFHIYLPASGKELPRAGEVNGKILTGTGRVLVMDDEEIIRDVLGEILTILGYEPAFASEGAAALELYRKAREAGRPFAAVIMDLTIPGGMGGKEAVKRLLETDPGAVVIVSSGYSNDPIMADYKKYGFSDVIAKPYKMEELSEKLYALLGGGSRP